jgi:hypothetical protein
MTETLINSPPIFCAKYFWGTMLTNTGKGSAPMPNVGEATTREKRKNPVFKQRHRITQSLLSLNNAAFPNTLEKK